MTGRFDLMRKSGAGAFAPAVALALAVWFPAVAGAADGGGAANGSLTCKDYGAVIECDNGEIYRRQPRMASRPPTAVVVHRAIRQAYQECIGLLPPETMHLPRNLQYERFPAFPACLKRSENEQLNGDEPAARAFEAMLGLH